MSYMRDRRGTLDALDRVGRERDRQELLVVAGKFEMTCADKRMKHCANDRLDVLAEEYAEAVIEATRPGPDLRKLRTELTQLAAVAVAWVEAIDAQLESERLAYLRTPDAPDEAA